MVQKQMSLRAIAKELGVSHTLLSLWRQGKRSLAPEILAKLEGIKQRTGYKLEQSIKAQTAIQSPLCYHYTIGQ